jgi:hypothetical protein
MIAVPFVSVDFRALVRSGRDLCSLLPRQSLIWNGTTAMFEAIP